MNLNILIQIWQLILTKIGKNKKQLFYEKNYILRIYSIFINC